MKEDSRKKEQERLAKLRAAMTDTDIKGLRARAKARTKSLSLDEVGILFLLAREKAHR
jgi:hypothetical protein